MQETEPAKPPETTDHAGTPAPAQAPSAAPTGPAEPKHARATTRIVKLEMKGFKSFAQKTELPLGERYNCVIGPNGSGKSNILDALCFVLGKSSAKSMRVEKSANLIYNGGKTKNPAKEAEVSIYFDNLERTFPLDAPEIKITRIVKMNGTSAYKINDEMSTRAQILDLLTFAKIDPDGYNIILQGDITGLIKMSAEERRMLIDEISGIGEYEDKRHKADLELGKVDTQLKETEIVLAERGTYMKELRKERDQALKFKELEEKLKRNKMTIIWRKQNERQEKETKLAKQLADEEGRIATIQGKIDELKKQITEKKTRVKELNEELRQKSNKEQQSLNADIERLRVATATAKVKIDNLQSELKRITERRDDLAKSQTETKTKVEAIERQISEGKAREDAITKEITDLNTKLAAIRKKHNLEDASAVDEKIAAIDKDIDAVQEQIGKLRGEEQALLREHDRLEMQLQTIDGTLERLKELEKEHKEQVEELKRDKAAHAEKQKDLKEALEASKTLQKQHDTAEAKLRTAESDLAKARSRSIQIREAAQGSIAVQKILELRSKMNGIHGTVAELGSVKEEHSLALEIAAGGRIRSIVVDTDATAAKCIAYLKEHRLGVATFIPLNKVRGQTGTAPKHKGVVGLALDLVTYKSEFEAAFKYVFGSTVVVDDIENARAIGIGQYRMVTLTGDLVETSGAMTGGHLQRGKSSGMGFQEKELTDQLAKLEHQVLELETEEKTLAERIEKNTDYITSLRHTSAELEANITRLERILKLDSQDAGKDKEHKEALKKAFAESGKKLEDVQDKIQELNRKLTADKVEKQKLRDSLTELRNPAVLAELGAIDTKRQALDTERITIKAQTDNLKTQKASVYDPEIENFTRIFKQQDADEQRFRKELEKLTAQKASDEETLKVKDEEAKVFLKQFNTLFKERDGLGEDINKLEAKTIDEEEKIRKAEQQRGGVQIALAQVRAELAGIAEEAKQYEGVEPFKSKDLEDVEREIKQFDRMMADLGAINMKALEIYETAEKEYTELNTKKEVLLKEREQVLALIAEVDLKKKDLFLKMFAVINEEFKRIFLKLNTKGEAFLELENPEDPLNAGMNIKVRLSGNKFLDINSLSGGEKTMTALAFLFAIQEHEPAQFYVLDEIDAALDKRNAEKLGALIRQYCDRAQYIIISHNDAVITQADQIYGVSMNEHGESKVASLKV